MTDSVAREDQILDVLRQRYEEKGFSFFKYPTRDLLPSFLGDYSPDAIALGRDQNVVIEVKAGPRYNAMNIARLADLFRGQEKWKFELVVADDVEETQIAPPAKESILQELSEAKELAASGHERAALIVAWAALEAAARMATIEPIFRPRTPKSLVELLEREGLISFEAAHELRSLADVRNAIVHGDVSRRVDANTIQALSQSVESILAA